MIEDVLLELFANIGLSMVSFLRGMPSEDRIKENMEKLKSTDWFLKLYQKNKTTFSKDEDIRYMIGWANVEKVLKSEARTEKLRKKLVNGINEK